MTERGRDKEREREGKALRAVVAEEIDRDRGRGRETGGSSHFSDSSRNMFPTEPRSVSLSRPFGQIYD